MILEARNSGKKRLIKFGAVDWILNCIQMKVGECTWGNPTIHCGIMHKCAQSWTVMHTAGNCNETFDVEKQFHGLTHTIQLIKLYIWLTLAVDICVDNCGRSGNTQRCVFGSKKKEKT